MATFLKLLRIDCMIWLENKSVKTILILWVLSIIVFPLVIIPMLGGRENIDYDFFSKAFSFPMVYNTMTVVELVPAQILSVLIIVIICHEIEFKTYRLHLLNGLTRYHLWLSKLNLALALSALMTFGSLLLALCYGLIFSDTVFMLDGAIYWSLVLFFQCFAFISFGIFFALIFKQTGTAILLYLLWFSFFERIFCQVINYVPPFKLFPLGCMFPGKSIEDLSVLQVFKQFYIQNNLFVPQRAAAGCFWVIITCIMNLVFFRRRKF